MLYIEESNVMYSYPPLKNVFLEKACSLIEVISANSYSKTLLPRVSFFILLDSLFPI